MRPVFYSPLLLVFVVSGLVIAATASASGGDGSTVALKRIVFAHRHGARTPMMNTENACAALGCGSLTEEGAKMLESLGRSFRARYGSVIPEHYDYRTTKVVTDLSPRCSQSADAFLKALYAPYNKSNGTQAHPLDLRVVDTAGFNVLGPWHALPTFALHNKPMRTAYELALAGYVEKHIISKDKIEALQKEVNFTMKECYDTRMECLHDVIDFAYSMRAMGRLSEFPLCQKYLPLLFKARLFLYQQEEGAFDMQYLHDDFFELAGYPGAGLFLAMLESSVNDDGVVVSEYSGHDSSLLPLYVAMNLTWRYPEFATALVFEVYESAGNGTRDTNPFIKPFLAACDQLPGGHPYAWSAVPATCTNEANVTYTTTRGCPHDDFVRFAKTRVTKSPAGNCYAWPQDLKGANCTGATAPAQGTACWKYRSACPLYACGAGSYMAPDLSCHAT